MIKSGLFAAVALTVSQLGAAANAADYTLSVSLDTSPQHVRNVWFRDFATKLEEKIRGPAWPRDF